MKYSSIPYLQKYYFDTKCIPLKWNLKLFVIFSGIEYGFNYNIIDSFLLTITLKNTFGFGKKNQKNYIISWFCIHQKSHEQLKQLSSEYTGLRTTANNMYCKIQLRYIISCPVPRSKINFRFPIEKLFLLIKITK